MSSEMYCVGLQTGVATMEINVVNSQKAKNMSTI